MHLEIKIKTYIMLIFGILMTEFPSYANLPEENALVASYFYQPQREPSHSQRCPCEPRVLN